MNPLSSMENDNDGDSNSNKTKFNTNTNTTNNMDYLTGTPNFGHDSYGAADYWHPNHNHAAPFSQQEAEACPTDGGQHKQAPVFTFTGTAVENYPPFPAAATGTSLASTPNLAPAQQDVPASSSFTNPPSKRQRRSSTGIGDRGRAAATGFREEDPDSRCGTPSECCSNCRGGEACDEPDCSPCDDLDCAAEDDEEVEICNEKSCSKPACREGCFSIAFQNHTSLCDRDAAQESSVPLTGALGNAQIAHRGMKPSRMTMVPARFESSPATTPSMAGNSEASPSPYPALPTPYADPGSGEMSGTGSLISTPEPWGDATYGSMNNGSGQDSLPCLWEGCDYVGLNHNEWSIHFHMNHIDTQMSFACPIPAGNCPATIDTNPMNHLQDFHDFNWDFGNFPALCPATSCPPDQTFLSPEMLHNHFDSAHATPVQGSLQCRLQTCGNTVFDDPDQFISHMQFHLQAPISRNEEDVALLVAPDPATTKAGDKTEACKAISIPHMCMWKSKDGELCNFEGKDPSNLQDHVKEQHLSTLGKSTGYLCQWDSCRRDANLGEKSGFSQRGKLERHMATHTGCESSPGTARDHTC